MNNQTYVLDFYPCQWTILLFFVINLCDIRFHFAGFPLRHFFPLEFPFHPNKKVQGIPVGVFMMEKNPQKSKHAFFVTGSSRLFTDDEVDEEGTPDLQQNEELPDWDV